jgi:DNA-binding response OmpR family regulator
MMQSNIDLEFPGADSSEMPKLLLVDDDVHLAEMVEQFLSFDHYQVEVASDGEEALHMLRSNSYDLAIVDLNLPSLSGTEICSQYRAGGGKIPILMLTAQTAVSERVGGLESGADDYLTKPFAMVELQARLKAILRRADRQLAEDKLSLGSITLHPSSFRATLNGQEVRLLRKEFSIIELLIRYPDRIFSPDEIISRVWQSDEYPSGEVVRSHIRNIRKKLGDDAIKTIHGVGYKAESPDK